MTETKTEVLRQWVARSSSKPEGFSGENRVIEGQLDPHTRDGSTEIVEEGSPVVNVIIFPRQERIIIRQIINKYFGLDEE